MTTSIAPSRFANVSRRAALQGVAGLVIAAHLPLKGARGQDGGAPLAPNAFVRVGADDTVTVISRNLEFGQGPYTGLATLVAEELDADWGQVRAEAAPANTALYANPAFQLQGTGGSTSMTTSYVTMRQAGAAARALLVGAAAEAWGVPVSEITVEAGVIRHAASGREGRFGEFVEAAAARPAPDLASVTLKDPADFRLIGKDVVGRLDSPVKANGTAEFTQDIQAPDMLTVVLARPPRFGAQVASFDATDALAVNGVVDVKALPTGVAVYAEGT